MYRNGGGVWGVVNAIIDNKNSKNFNEIRRNVEEWVDCVYKSKNRNVKWDEETVPKRRISECLDYDSDDNIDKVRNFLKNVDVSTFVCEFNIPQVRSRLEKLMGTNYVNLTDREYMQKLQKRILEDYAESMEKRIKAREEDEMERVKNLVLLGKIPLEQAPPEMARHPIMLIENYCNKLIAQRRAKIKVYKVKIPTYLYWDDTPDPPTGLSIEMGHVFGNEGDKLCRPVDTHLETSEEEDIQSGYMMSKEEYDKTTKYENDLIKKLLSCETVEEMYTLADNIIGILKSIDETAKVQEDSISNVLNGT